MSATEILIRFDFPVDQSGYEIVEIPDTHHMGPEDVAISDTPYIIGKSSVYRDHRDFFENFPIHKILAEMDERKSSDDDVINFCNKYGLLWHNTPTSIPVDLPRLHRDLYNPFKISANKLPRYEMMALEGFWFFQGRVKSAVTYLEQGDIKRFGHDFNMAGVSSTPMIDLEGKKQLSKKNWQLRPHNLYSAIWLLMHEEMLSGPKWHRCKYCQGWFVPPTARNEYCQRSCRQAVYRRNLLEKEKASHGDK